MNSVKVLGYKTYDHWNKEQNRCVCEVEQQMELPFLKAERNNREHV